MDFYTQLRQEVKQHGEQKIDFQSRRFQHGRDLARTYIEIIKEEALLQVRSGHYERVGEQIIINGFCAISLRDFDVPVTQLLRKQSFLTGKWSDQYTLTQGNDLFEAFCTSLAEFCAREQIRCGPFQAQVRRKDGTLTLRPFPLTVAQPDVLMAMGFPFAIVLDITAKN